MPDCDFGDPGSIPGSYPPVPVAQLEEQTPSKRPAAGSNPVRDTGLIAQPVSAHGFDPWDSGSYPDGAIRHLRLMDGRESAKLQVPDRDRQVSFYPYSSAE